MSYLKLESNFFSHFENSIYLTPSLIPNHFQRLYLSSSISVYQSFIRSNPPTFSQKDEPILLKVIDIYFIHSYYNKSFAITKFTPFSLRNTARDFNSQEKIKTLDDPLSKKGDTVDVSLDPKISSFFEKKEDPKIESSKNQVHEGDI